MFLQTILKKFKGDTVFGGIFMITMLNSRNLILFLLR